MKINAPPLDAEKSSSKQIVENYRPPPEIGSSLMRSTLLIGTRGVGKTFYLRHLRHCFDGFSIYADLRKILNPITSDTGAGGVTFKEISATVEPLIQRKTISLLAFWIFSRAIEAKLNVNVKYLKKCLPQKIGDIVDQKKEYLDDIYDELEIAPLSVFSGIGRVGHFEYLLEHINEISQHEKGQMIILLDRAEEVPYPSLSPILSLLDQRFGFLVVVASRPGILGPYHQLDSAVPVPGDHYNIKHLGYLPYSADWRKFVISVLNSWLSLSDISITDDELSWIVNISRDSIRTALEILYSSIDETGSYNSTKAIHQMKLIRESQLKSCQGQLRRLISDVPGLIRKTRRRASQVSIPVSISIRKTIQQPLFDTPTHLRDMPRDEKAIYLGLRTGLFRTLHGQIWHPYYKITKFEIPPLFIWEEGDKWSNI